MLQEDYRVTLDSFQGPLDLLLFLIRRAEVDITDIPIAKITDQYLAFLRQVEDVDVELAGEFLVMASTLIELKSRMLVPGAAASDDDGDQGTVAESTDPRFDLVRQLLAYQRFRVASEELDDRRHAFARRYARRPGRANARIGAEPTDDGEEAGPTTPLELEDVHVMDLADAYEHIMASIDFTRLGDHVVEMDDTPIALHQEDLLDRLRRAEARRLTLQSVFAGQAPIQRVGLFLATLELARMRTIRVEQEEIDAAIEIQLRDEADAETEAEAGTPG